MYVYKAITHTPCGPQATNQTEKRECEREGRISAAHAKQIKIAI